MVTCCSVFESGVSAVSGVSLYSAITFYRVSALAILLSVIIKMTEYRLEYGRNSAKFVLVASIIELLGYIVVRSTLSKTSKYFRALIPAIQRSMICFMFA